MGTEKTITYFVINSDESDFYLGLANRTVSGGLCFLVDGEGFIGRGTCSNGKGFDGYTSRRGNSLFGSGTEFLRRQIGAYAENTSIAAIVHSRREKDFVDVARRAGYSAVRSSRQL